MSNNQQETQLMFEQLRDNLNTNREESRADIKELRDENRKLAQEGREASERFADSINARVDSIGRENTRVIEKLTDVLLKHVTDDAGSFKEQADNASRNHKELSERIACIEQAETTTEKVKETGWSRLVGFSGMVAGWVVAAGAIALLFVTYFHS